MTVRHYPGESLSLPERLVLAPASGTYRARPPSVYTTEGEIVAQSQEIGVVVTRDEEFTVVSSCRGYLMRMLVTDGERVRRGQPIAWLRQV